MVFDYSGDDVARGGVGRGGKCPVYQCTSEAGEVRVCCALTGSPQRSRCSIATNLPQWQTSLENCTF